MIFQKNTQNMRLIVVMKILDKCNITVRYQKTMTKAYLMNGMKEFQDKNLTILQINMIL